MADYATTAEVKTRINKTRADEDASIAALITAASRAIDEYCNRPDGFVAPAAGVARLYTGTGDFYMFVDEFIAVSAVEVKDSPSDTTYVAWSSGDYLAFAGDPATPEFNRLPFHGLMVSATGDYDIFTSGQYSSRRPGQPSRTTRRGVPTVRVTARWGYAATVPAVVKEACIAQTARWLKRSEAAWADSIAKGEFEQLQYFKGLDEAVQLMLSQMIRMAI